MLEPPLIDAHCHLSEEPLWSRLHQEMHCARQQNIRTFISTALTVPQVNRHLQENNPEVKLSAGIHPHYHKENLIDIPYLQHLAEQKLLWAIGEIGLDKRNKEHNRQCRLLYRQLELVGEFDLPVIFHIVGRYNELYRILRDHFPNIRAYIHGFTGPPELVKMLAKLNIGFSLGDRIVHQKNAAATLKTIIDYGFFLFETDAPFQQRPLKDDGNMYLSRLANTVRQVGELTGVDYDVLLDKQFRNYKYLTDR